MVQSRLLPCLVLLAITAVAYLNADHEEFLFDSGLRHIDRPEHTAGPLQATKTFCQGQLNPDAPFTYLTFAWNYSVNKALGLDGFDITSLLIVNVIIHAVNAWLVFFLVRAMLRQVEPGRPPALWIPLALAVLFAVHPTHASSVAYIIQRRGALATTFYLLAVLCLLRVRRPPGSDKGPGRASSDKQAKSPSTWPWSRILLAAAIPVLYWFSFRSKNLGVTLPFALLAVEFCLRAPDRAALKRYLTLMIPGLVICTLGMFVFLWMRELFDPRTFTIHYFGPQTPQGPWHHFLTESRVFVHYWKLLLLPLPCWSSIDHDFTLSTHLWDHYAIVALSFHGLLLALAVYAALKRYTLAATGIFWFYIALMPYAALPQREFFVEYKTYLPSVGLVLILAELLRLVRHRVPTVVQVMVFVVVAAALLSTTIRRNVIYQSALNLWSDAVKKCPKHPRPHNNLGNALAARGDLDGAIQHYRLALQLRPAYPNAHSNLATALAEQGRNNEAIQHYRGALQLQPDDPEVHNNLGHLLFKQGALDKAKEHFLAALQLKPDYAEVHNNLGYLLAEQGKIDEAVGHFNEALRLLPDSAEAQYNLAKAQASKGRPDEAIAHYRRALNLKPDDPELHNNLAVILVQLGKIAEAYKHYNEALRFKPDFPEAHNNLGYLLAERGRIDEAIGHFSEAVRHSPSFAKAHHNLAKALAVQGKIDQAITHFSQALHFQPDYPEAHNNLAVILAGQGRIDEAIVHYNEALRLQPNYPRAHVRLGKALAQQGKLDTAITHYNEALRLKPDFPEAHYRFAETLVELGKIQQAIPHYREAIRLEPKQPTVLNLLARTLATSARSELRNPIEAVRLAERACARTRYERPDMLDTLAAAYAAAGNFEAAARTAQKAISIATDKQVDDPLVDGLRKRLKLYEMGQPYREPAPPTRHQAPENGSPASLPNQE